MQLRVLLLKIGLNLLHVLSEALAMVAALLGLDGNHAVRDWLRLVFAPDGTQIEGWQFGAHSLRNRILLQGRWAMIHKFLARIDLSHVPALRMDLLQWGWLASQSFTG